MAEPTKQVTCRSCQGSGIETIPYLYMGFPKHRRTKNPCPRCAGTKKLEVTIKEYYRMWADPPRHLRHRLMASHRPGAGLGIIPPRSILMGRLCKRAGHTNFGDWAAAQYRTGRVSPTLYSVMDATNMARMQYLLGFSTQCGGKLVPEFPHVVR